MPLTQRNVSSHGASEELAVWVMLSSEMSMFQDSSNFLTPRTEGFEECGVVRPTVLLSMILVIPFAIQ